MSSCESCNSKSSCPSSAQGECPGQGSTPERPVFDELHVPLLDRMPVDPRLVDLCDTGRLEEYDMLLLDGTVQAINHVLKGKS